MDLKSSAVSALSFEIWVSPTGDDEGGGGADAPFRSLRQALDALHAIARFATRATSITVYLVDGMQGLDAPMVFDAQRAGSDGPLIRFVAVPGTNPTGSGAAALEGGTLYDSALIRRQPLSGARSARDSATDDPMRC
jgi:hypothetical protein